MARRKKKTTSPSRVIIEEWKDWKAGDIAWAKTFVTNKLIRGEIKEFHLNDRHGVAVTLLEHINGHYVTVLAQSLQEEDPRKKNQKSLDVVQKVKDKKRDTSSYTIRTIDYTYKAYHKDVNYV